MSAEPIVFERTIQAPVGQVYRAFTNSTAFREWMCDQCIAEPHPGGRLYFGWVGGFYAAGEFTAAEPDKSVAFTWLGRGEPAPSWVKVTLSEKDGGSSLYLEHGGGGVGKEWDRSRSLWKMNWESGLENLVAVLETGQDLRIVNRPMLGILLDDFNKEIASRLGVPVSQGVRISGVLDGMGAQAAGLQADDVIVRVNKTEVKEFSDLGNELQSASAGKEMDVEYYRGAEKKTVRFKLSGRPIPEIPASVQDLAAVVQKHFAGIPPALDQLFAGVTEAEAGYRSGPQEWSAKETLAHLIHEERNAHRSLEEAVGSNEAQYDTFGGNWIGHNRATVQAFPTIADLLGEYKRLIAETVALYAALPDEFFARKGSYWRLAFNSLSAPLSHFDGHLAQMKLSIEAARKAS